MRRILFVLALIGAQFANAQVNGDTLTLQAPLPSGAQRASATAVGAAGTVNLYYYVATRYPQGLVLSPVITAANTVGIANLTGVNYVQIGWVAANGATGYYVIRGTTPTFLSSGTCTNCVVVANTANTTFSDVGGAVINWPPAGVPTASASRWNLILDNVTLASPYLPSLMNGVPGISIYMDGIAADNSALWRADENQYQWRTESSVFIGALAGANVDWSARTGAVDGYGARIENDMSSTTSMQGADIRVTIDGGNGSPATLAAGVQGVGIAAAGTVSLGELYGGNFVTLDQAGGGVNRFGAVGNLAFSGATTGGSLFNAGLYGEYSDGAAVQISTPGTDFTAGVMGVVNNTAAGNRPSDAAVMALLATGNPTAAFMAIQRNVNPGVAYDYGLDLYGTTGFNTYNAGDIRGQNQDLLINNAAGSWQVSSAGATPEIFGFRGGTTFANLGTPADGVMTYCTDCDPGGGAVVACTSAGAQTGAWAFRINSNWDCISR